MIEKMIENQKLVHLLVKFEDKIDSFIRDKSINEHVAKDIKDFIHEKLTILDKRK